MLKARAVERFLGQVVDKSSGITGVMLFDKDGNFFVWNDGSTIFLNSKYVLLKTLNPPILISVLENHAFSHQKWRILLIRISAQL